MTRIIGVIVGLLVVIALMGYFRGWFHAESHDSAGQHTVTLTVDQAKLNQDKAKLQRDVHELGHK